MTTWQTFLNTQQVHTEANHIIHFGNLSAELQATQEHWLVITDLSHLGLLQIEGEDRINFLQGQVTNDIKLLDGSNCHYTGYCTPKGRLLALFLAFAHHDHINLQLHRQLLEPIMKRLKMYVLRSKVTISDMSDQIIRIGIAGSESENVLQSLYGSAPTEPHVLINLPDAVILRLPGKTPRFEIFTQADQAEATWHELRQHATPVGKPCWDWLEIEAGIPEIGPETQEAFVPQMVNLDVLGGINFKKGCYTGQEIVARTHYLGKVKRRTYPVSIAEGSPIQAGGKVLSASGLEAGMIVRTAPNASGGYAALVEVRLEALEEGSLRLEDGRLLTVEALPYLLPQEA